MKKILALTLAAALTIPAATSVFAEEEKDVKDIKIGFAVSDMSDAFFAHLVQNIQDYADEVGVTLTVKEAPEIIDKITAIENFVESGCDTVICHVTDADALKDAAMSAEEAGVHFV